MSVATRSVNRHQERVGHALLHELEGFVLAIDTLDKITEFLGGLCDRERFHRNTLCRRAGLVKELIDESGWSNSSLIPCQLDSGAQDQQIHDSEMKASALPKPRESSGDALLLSRVSILPRPLLGARGPASVPTVDQVMVEERAASFGKRSIKTITKIAGLRMVSSMMDL